VRRAAPLLWIATLIAVASGACQTDREGDLPEAPVVVEKPAPDTGARDSAPGRHDGSSADVATSEDTFDARSRRLAACPMAVDGTRLEVERRPDTVVLSFTTPGDADDLRDRVHQLARRHNERRDEGRRGERAEADELPHERMLMLRRATASTEPVDDGLRLVLTPDDADDLETLYRHMANMQSRIADMDHRPDCPMFRMMEMGTDGQR
jgi:hypothetical protein